MKNSREWIKDIHDRYNARIAAQKKKRAFIIRTVCSFAACIVVVIATILVAPKITQINNNVVPLENVSSAIESDINTISTNSSQNVASSISSLQSSTSGESKNNSTSPQQDNAKPSQENSSKAQQSAGANNATTQTVLMPFLDNNNKIYSISKRLDPTDIEGVFYGGYYQIKGVNPSVSFAVINNNYYEFDYLMDYHFSFNGESYVINTFTYDSSTIENKLGNIDNHNIYSIKGATNSQEVAVQLYSEFYATDYYVYAVKK